MPIFVTIDGVDAGSRIIPESVVFQTVLNERGTASFTLKSPIGDSLTPRIGLKVIIADNSENVWAGSIDTLSQTFLGYSGYLAYDVTCVSLEQRLDLHFISPRLYGNTNAGAVVADLLSSVAGGDGIEPGQIDPGVDISRIYYDYDRLTDAFKYLADVSGYFISVDANSRLNFIARDTLPAPFVLDGIRALYGNLNLQTTRQDRRLKQMIRISWSAFAPEKETLVGDGETVNFSVSKNIKRVESIVLTSGTASSSNGLFSGLPSDGEILSIAGFTYAFVSSLDNTFPRLILIGADGAACAQNLSDAVNGSQSGRGVTYSQPTPVNFSVSASAEGGLITITAKQPGVGGDLFNLTTHLSNFSWATDSLTGGVDPTEPDQVQTIGIADVDTDSDWFYTIGEAGLFNGTGPMPIGVSAVVSYRPVGGDVITVQDDGLITEVGGDEHSNGSYENLIEDTTITDINIAILKAQGLLDTFKTLADTLQVETDFRDVKIGQLLTVAVDPPFSDINGDWLIQQVNGFYQGLARNNFRYRLTAINASRKGTWLSLFENLGGRGGGSSSSLAIGGGGSTEPFVICVFGRGTDGKHASVAVDDVTNSKTATRSGSPSRWVVDADVAPTGSDAIIDITVDGVSIFGTDGGIGGTTVANGTTAVTGNGTAFLTDVHVGDKLAVSSSPTTYRIVTAVLDDTHLTVDAALGDGTSQTFLVKYSRVVIPDGATTNSGGKIRAVAIAKGVSLLQGKIKQVGSTTPGKSFTVELF